MDDPEELLTIKEFAERVNISLSTVRGWVYARVLPRIQIRRLIRIPYRRAMVALEKHYHAEGEPVQKA
jgi:excisionase family DNA binding protein